MIELKSIIHLYLGCEVKEDYTSNDKGRLVGYSMVSNEVLVLHKVVWTFKINEIKPILRKLSDMKEEESVELAHIYTGADTITPVKGTVSNFRYFVCSFRKSNGGGIDEHLIIDHKGEAWYRHYFDKSEKGYKNIVRTHEGTVWLLKKGFDIFDLIPSGQAIDATTLNNQKG